MKYIYKILFSILIIAINYFSVNADFSICDSWNINVNSNSIIEICNWWLLINSFTWELAGNYINNNPWFWWNIESFNSVLNINIDNNIWFFDNNKSTIITKINPESNFAIWFINEFNMNLFNSWTNDIINNIENTWSLNWINIKDYYNNLFRKYSEDKYENLWISKTEYDEFINNLLDLLISSSYDNNKQLINNNDIKIIEKNLEKYNFPKNILKLLSNSREINNSFSLMPELNKKYFILSFYLNL